MEGEENRSYLTEKERREEDGRLGGEDGRLDFLERGKDGRSVGFFGERKEERKKKRGDMGLERGFQIDFEKEREEKRWRKKAHAWPNIASHLKHSPFSY